MKFLNILKFFVYALKQEKVSSDVIRNILHDNIGFVYLFIKGIIPKGG